MKRIPLCISADAYTVSSNIFASKDCKEKSTYNFTNRLSPSKALPELANDSRMVFYGLSEFIRDVLCVPVALEDIENSAEFMARAGSFGTELHFPQELWENVVHDYNGFLPIKIEAIADGSTFFPNEPVIQVSSTASGFGELAAHIEAIMVGQVACASAKATISRHWLKKMCEWTERGSKLNDLQAVLATAQWMIHDFGMRASSCEYESRILGKAHLLSFNGTDTFNAAYEAWQEGCHHITGTSIHALAHRNVQGYERYGATGENMAFGMINFASKNTGNIASYVSDCYNFERAAEKCANIAQADAKNIVVCRPDSGKAVENIAYIIGLALERKLTNNRSATKLRYIEGNTVTPKLTDEVFEMIEGMDLNPVGWGIFGVGGYMRNNATRDTFSSAFKLAAIGNDNYPVCKLSKDEIKMSIPGECEIHRPTVDNQISVTMRKDKDSRSSRYTTKYDTGLFNYKEAFSIKQDRCIQDFNSYNELMKVNPDFGVDCKHLSQSIIDVRKETVRKYRG